MKGRFIYHTNCEQCGSSDALAVYEQEDGKKDATCFSCRHYVSDIEAPVTQTNRPERETQVEPATLPLVSTTIRGIEPSVYQQFGVRVEYSEETREPKAVYFPYVTDGRITGWKKRDLHEKSFVAFGNMKSAPLFGNQVHSSKGKMVVVTEGEFDALAATQIFQQHGKDYRVVSLPNGANIRGIKDNLQYLEGFESVILCVDQDDAGQKLIDQVGGILSPGRIRVMRFDEKDANEMLVKGKQKEFMFALNRSEPYRADGVIGVDDIWEQACKPVQRGGDWPWPRISAITYGRRRKELYGFGGGTGSGKTEAFKQVISHVLNVDKLPVGLLFLEEEPSHTLKVLAGKATGKRFHVPDSGWTEGELKAALEQMRGKVYLYNHFGCKEWAQLKPKIRYMVVSLGIKDIFLDHLTALVAEQEDVNGSLSKIMADMASLTQELDFTLYYISHLSTPTGVSHEEGGRVTVSQFRGSRTIGFWTHFLFGIERNQQHEDPQERHSPTLRVLKDRLTGSATGETVRLFYNHETGNLLEREEPVDFDSDYEEVG